jgi:hypothetical protein
MSQSATLMALERQIQERARLLEWELARHGDGRVRLKSVRDEIARTAAELRDVRNRLRREMKSSTSGTPSLMPSLIEK